MKRLEQIEQDLRQFGQRQMAVLSSTSMKQLRVICDRMWSLRVDLAGDNDEADMG